MENASRSIPATCGSFRSAASCTERGPAEIFQSIALRRTAGSVECAMIWSAASAIRADRLRPISKSRNCSSFAERATPGDDCMGRPSESARWRTHRRQAPQAAMAGTPRHRARARATTGGAEIIPSASEHTRATGRS